MSAKEQAARLAADFGFMPVVAAEIEFYLHGSDTHDMALFWSQVRARAEAASIGIFKYEKEKGAGQYEVALMPVDPAKAAENCERIKIILSDIALEQGMIADFSAAPIEGEPGSGLHIHVHLADANGKNVFYKDDDSISDTLKFSIGGLLAAIPGSMSIFAPHEESYRRFKPGMNAPLTVSWGANNRTVALRLPQAPHEGKHIEHRVAGADADPYAVIAAILAAMHDGLTCKTEPGPQIYGDASDAQYNLPRLSSASIL